METPFLSIIIPVYNAAASIERTLQSCRDQTSDNIEIIIVNDGSTDNTTSIIENSIKHDPNFILINQSNGGVSSARNLGIAKSNGRYISFLDSDDLIDNYFSSYAEDIIEQNQAIDVFIYGYEKLRKKSSITNGPHTTEILNNYSPYDVMEQNPTVWAKIYRSSLIKEKIQFYKANTLEDVFFALEVLTLKPIVFTAKRYPYKYIMHDVSLSQSIRKGIIDQRQDIVKTYYSRFLSQGNRDESSFVTFFMARILKQVFISCSTNMRKEDQFLSYKQSLQYVQEFNNTIKKDFHYKGNWGLLKKIKTNRIKVAYLLIQISRVLPIRLSFVLFKLIS